MDILRNIEINVNGNLYTLDTWDTGRTDWRGQTVIRYRFSQGVNILFAGEDFAGSPLHSDDSDETVRSLLTFLTRCGDEYDDYNDGYTEAQQAWAQSSDRERLACDLACMEDGGAAPWENLDGWGE